MGAVWGGLLFAFIILFSAYLIPLHGCPRIRCSQKWSFEDEHRKRRNSSNDFSGRAGLPVP